VHYQGAIMQRPVVKNSAIAVFVFILVVLAFLAYAVGSLSSRIETLEYVSRMHSEYNSLLAQRARAAAADQ